MKYILNPSISEEQDSVWFSYDNESMNFLLKYEKKEYTLQSDMYFHNDMIYLEDYYPLSSSIALEELNGFYVNLTYTPKSDIDYGTMTKKFKISNETNMNDLFELMNDKLNIMQKSLMFDPKSKILKAKSKNDYIFNLNTPLIDYAYIKDCISNSIQARYLIIDNPFNENENENEQKDNSQGEIDEMIEISNHILLPKERYSSYQKYDIKDNQKRKSVIGNSILLNKEANKHEINEALITNNTVSPFMKSLIEEIKLYRKSKCDNKLKSYIDELIIDDIDLNDNLNINTISNKLTILESSRIAKIFKKAPVKKQKRKNYNSILMRVMPPGYQFTINQFASKNIFKNNINSSIDINALRIRNKDHIAITTIDKPFSLIIRNVYLNNLYNTLPPESNAFKSILLFSFQINAGKHRFSDAKCIKWETSSEDNNPLFNQRLYFNINYNTLPLLGSLMIQLKLIRLLKDNKTETVKICWGNFKLFDHNRQLRTGLHKISFYKYPISQGMFYGSFDSYCDFSSWITFELDSFSNSILYEAILPIQTKIDLKSIIIDKRDLQQIELIKKKPPFTVLDNYDKDVIWRNRYYLTQEPILLVKVFQCIDYTNRSHLYELEKLISISKSLNIIHALQLLTEEYHHPLIRSYAIKCLEQCQPGDIEVFLMQLVQGLKYEMFHDSYLAEYLLRLAISYPLTIGHSLFWNLKSEMNNIYYKQRFSLYLEVFLIKIGSKILKIYENEVGFMRELQSISNIPKNTSIHKTERRFLLTNALSVLHNQIVNEFKEVSIPYDFKLRIKGIKVNQCRSMKSKKKPLWLVLENSDTNGEDVVILYKAGDDLRMDIITLQLFRIMQSIWIENKLRLKMTVYNVICTGVNQGIVEIVKHSETLAQIHIKEGGAMQSFSKDAVKQWLNKTSTCSKEESAENFLLSCVAYCVATFVLGIGDRHNDNIMIKHNGELFHIDFGHFLGHFKYKMGIKRERAPFVFTKQFQSILENEAKYNFALFKGKFGEAYQLLRKNCDRLVIVLKFLLNTGIPELNETSIKFIEASLCLNDNSREAKRYLESQLNESLNSLSVELNFWIHIIANQ